MTDDRFAVFDSLRQHNTRLLDNAHLENGTGLAAWYNERDLIALENADHHTLSLYTADGYQSYFKAADGWHNGGGRTACVCCHDSTPPPGTFAGRCRSSICISPISTCASWPSRPGIAAP